jgi:hypothetical protein
MGGSAPIDRSTGCTISAAMVSAYRAIRNACRPWRHRESAGRARGGDAEWGDRSNLTPVNEEMFDAVRASPRFSLAPRGWLCRRVPRRSAVAADASATVPFRRRLTLSRRSRRRLRRRHSAGSRIARARRRLQTHFTNVGCGNRAKHREVREVHRPPTPGRRPPRARSIDGRNRSSASMSVPCLTMPRTLRRYHRARRNTPACPARPRRGQGRMCVAGT